MFKRQFKARRPAVRRPSYKSVSSIVKKELVKNTEKKWNITTGVRTTYVCDTTGYVGALHSLAQGDDANSRDGNLVKTLSLDFKGIVDVEPSTGTDQIARVLIGYKRDGASVPAITDVLESANVYSARKMSQIGENVVLMDKIINLNKDAESGSKRVIKFFKKLAMPQRYSGSASTTCIQNQLWIITLGSNPQGTSASGLSFNSVLRYIDF